MDVREFLYITSHMPSLCTVAVTLREDWYLEFRPLHIQFHQGVKNIQITQYHQGATNMELRTPDLSIHHIMTILNAFPNIERIGIERGPHILNVVLDLIVSTLKHVKRIDIIQTFFEPSEEDEVVSLHGLGFEDDDALSMSSAEDTSGPLHASGLFTVPYMLAFKTRHPDIQIEFGEHVGLTRGHGHSHFSVVPFSKVLDDIVGLQSPYYSL